MKNILSMVVMACVLAACSSKYKEPYHAPTFSANGASVQGSYLKATGGLNSLGGLLETNGYIKIAAVNSQAVNDEKSFISAMTLGGNSSEDFKRIPLRVGLNTIDLDVQLGSWSGTKSIQLNAQPGTHYTVLGENQGFGGNFWVQDQTGKRIGQGTLRLK